MKRNSGKLEVAIKVAELGFVAARNSYVSSVFLAVDDSIKREEEITSEEFCRALSAAKILWGPTATKFNQIIADRAGVSVATVNSWSPTKSGSRIICPDKFTRSGVLKIVSTLVKERLNNPCEP